jgi:hypothetical protein
MAFAALPLFSYSSLFLAAVAAQLFIKPQLRQLICKIMQAS